MRSDPSRTTQRVFQIPCSLCSDEWDSWTLFDVVGSNSWIGDNASERVVCSADVCRCSACRSSVFAVTRNLGGLFTLTINTRNHWSMPKMDSLLLLMFRLIIAIFNRIICAYVEYIHIVVMFPHSIWLSVFHKIMWLQMQWLYLQHIINILHCDHEPLTDSPSSCPIQRLQPSASCCVNLLG